MLRFSTLLLFLAGANAAQMMGYVIDKQCLGLCTGEPEGTSCTPDQVNVFYEPEKHTGWCLLLQVCIDSGYVLMSGPDDVDAEGKRKVLLDFAGEESQANVLSFIKSGSQGHFPLVSVEYDEALAETKEGVVHAQKAEVTDLWESKADEYYSGEDTHQVVCPDSTSPDLFSNNLCMRSDVSVTKMGETHYVIESNGCPDHPNMQGSSGKLENTQADPSEESQGGQGNDDNSCCSGANPCCSGGKDTCCSGGTTCCSGGKDTCCSGGTTCCSGGKDTCCSGGTTCCSGGKDTCCSGGTTCCSGGKDTCCSGGKDTCCSGGTTCCSGGTTCCSGGNDTCCSGGTTCCSGGKDTCCSGGTTCCSGGKDCCGTGCCGGDKESTNGHGDYDPLYHHYKMIIPVNPGAPGEAKYFGNLKYFRPEDDVVGIMVNGVLLDSHKQTWSYDNCVGHSDSNGQYHYHLPPYCFLEELGVPTPDSPTWFATDDGKSVLAYEQMASKFDSEGTHVVVGHARDGYPIFANYDDQKKLQRGATYQEGLDECNGKTDSKGNYGYYLTADPPFAPPCLKGDIGLFSYHSTDKTCPTDGINNKVLQSEVVVSKCEQISFSDVGDCVSSGALDEEESIAAPKCFAGAAAGFALAAVAVFQL